MNKVIEGNNKYCGPAVLSILSGKTTDECANAISYINGHYKVTGVQVSDLLKAAKLLRIDSKKIEPIGYSLFAVASNLVNEDGQYLILLSRHFVIIEVKDKKIYFCDNHTKEPINGAASARFGQRVLEIYKMFPFPVPKLVSTNIRLSVTDYSIHVSRVEIFEDSTDNHETVLGSIRAKNKEELIQIAETIGSAFESKLIVK